MKRNKKRPGLALFKKESNRLIDLPVWTGPIWLLRAPWVKWNALETLIFLTFVSDVFWFQAWNSNCSMIFTASSDGYCGQFNLKKSACVGKFKCDEGTKSSPIYSICVHPSDSSIITGSVARITWWDLDTRSPLKTFSGTHLGPVTIVMTVTIDAERCVLVSGGSSEQDHTLAVWNLSLAKEAIKAEDDTILAR